MPSTADETPVSEIGTSSMPSSSPKRMILANPARKGSIGGRRFSLNGPELRRNSESMGKGNNSDDEDEDGEMKTKGQRWSAHETYTTRMHGTRAPGRGEQRWD